MGDEAEVYGELSSHVREETVPFYVSLSGSITSFVCIRNKRDLLFAHYCPKRHGKHIGKNGS